MKKSTLLKAFGLLTLLFVFTACNRYDEGSNFSLLTAKARLANTWTVSSFSNTLGSTTTQVTGTSGTITIEKDGNWNSSFTYTFLGQQVTETQTGTWVFNDDKTQVITTDSDGDTQTMTIVKLKNKELALTTTDNNGGITRTDYTGE